MAYEKKWNPDALPAHAEPEQAAQALSNLQGNRKPLPPTTATQNTRPQSPARRFSPPSNQQSYKPPQPSAQIYNSSQNGFNHNNPNHNNPNYNNSNFNNFNHSSSNYSNPAQSNLNQVQSSYHDPRTNSPSPLSYGQRPPQQISAPQRPHAYSQPFRTPASPSPDPVSLFPLFRAANASQSGSLSHAELSSALVNGDYTSFDQYTIKMLLQLFSSSPSSDNINYDEFVSLWRFLGAWRDLFDRFDEDRSGKISLAEFTNALVAFGYRLSQPFIAVLYDSYNSRAAGQTAERRGSRRTDGMSFDLFVQACISLKRMTDVFKGYDEDRDGFITLSFEEFLMEIIRLRE